MAAPAGECPDFEICGRLASGTSQYCVLHDPAINAKSPQEFNVALVAHLQQGRCSFTRFQLPVSINSLDLRNRTFQQFLECVDLSPPRPILLDGGVLTKGGLITANAVGNLFLTHVKSGGPVEIRAKQFFEGSEVRLEYGAFEKDVIVSIESSTLNVDAPRAAFGGRLFVRAPTMLGTLNLGNGSVAAGVSLYTRNLGHIVFTGASLGGDVDLSLIECHNGVSFDQCSFGPSAEIDLRNCIVRGSLDIRSRVPPRCVRLDGATITGNTLIESPPSHPLIQVTARSESVRMLGTVLLKHVDISKCRLVGNVMPDFTLSGVAWARIPTFRGRFSRAALYDEVTCRNNEGPPKAGIREACENLKEKYRQLGDHVTSGDFHFGEMEMKLMERRPRERLRRLEWWYGWASGYGTRPGRAASVLGGLILLFATTYYLAAPWLVDGSIIQAVAFSIAVTTLQRPEVPRYASGLVRWAFLTETVLGPAQVALFLLALRMRVRR